MENEMLKYQKRIEELEKENSFLKEKLKLHENSTLIVEGVQDGIWITDENDIIRFVNKPMEQIAGIPCEKIQGNNVLQYFQKQATGELMEFYLKAKKERKALFYDIQMKTPAGKDTWQNGWLIPKYRNEQFIGLICTIRDITESKQASIKLKESEERYRELVNTINSGVAIYKVINDGKSGKDYIIQDFNSFSLQHEQLEKNDVIGKSLKDIRPNIDEYGLIDIFRKVWETGKTTFFPAKVYKDDKYSNYYENSIFRLPNHEIVAIYDDVSERENAINQIKISQKRFDLALSATKDGLFEWDLITNEIYYSPNWKKMLGYEDNELSNDFSVWEKLTCPEDVKKSWKMINQVTKKKRERFEMEFKMKHKNGHWVDVLSRVKTIFNEDGKSVKMIGTHVDITAIKKYEKELKVAKEKAEESDRLKTEFINNMSHEIRTPMNGILGFSKLLNKPNKSIEKRKHYVNIIQNSGNQLMRIIDDILEISKLGTKQVSINEKEICFNDMLLELFSIFDIKAKEIKIPLYLKKGLSDQDSLIFTDETKLNKVLSNLLENALKFTNTGFIEFGYLLKNSNLEIYIKDTGIGIKLEKHSIIFERFSQEEKELSKNVGGLGLGLSIAKENAELLGGKITLKSEKGKGATFIVTIPYKPANAKISNQGNDNNDIIEKQDKYTVLIVEDEEVNYLFIETLLKDEIEINCNIFHAKHGEEAVEMCKENPEIDFVLMDLKMPIMNGFEATKRIKELRPNLPIVAQTAYTTDEDKEKAFTAGCDDFISKPISEETLNEITKKHLTTK